ncbi:MAG TPA: hypothetical protein VNU68_10750 [Verrucomicrobiae bacterium]|nr:hypothetical protein [Verrucomicrobiae bacterium]
MNNRKPISKRVRQRQRQRTAQLKAKTDKAALANYLHKYGVKVKRRKPDKYNPKLLPQMKHRLPGSFESASR